MQQWWRDWALARAKSEPLPVEEPGDFGFYDETGAKEWGIEYLDSNRNPAHLPRPGGVMQQTLGARHDLRVINHLLAWAQWVAWRERRDQEELDKQDLRDYTT